MTVRVVVGVAVGAPEVRMDGTSELRGGNVQRDRLPAFTFLLDARIGVAFQTLCVRYGEPSARQSR